MSTFLTTTGIDVFVPDLRNLYIRHPEINFDLEDIFSVEELAQSQDLQTLVNNDTVILKRNFQIITDVHSIEKESERDRMVIVLENDLPAIEVTNPKEGDVLSLVNNVWRNFPKPDVQYKHSNTLWSTTGEGEDDDFWDTFSFSEDTQIDKDNAASWNIIGKAYLTADCVDLADYKITFNFVCSVSSNNRSMKFSIFKNSKEIETFTQEFFFSKKDEQKSITIIEFIRDVKKGDVISLRTQRGGDNKTTLSVGRRSMFIEELR